MCREVGRRIAPDTSVFWASWLLEILRISQRLYKRNTGRHGGVRCRWWYTRDITVGLEQEEGSRVVSPRTHGGEVDCTETRPKPLSAIIEFVSEFTR